MSRYFKGMHDFLTKRRICFIAAYSCVALLVLWCFYGSASFCNQNLKFHQIIALVIAVTLFELMGGLCNFILHKLLKGEPYLSLIFGGIVSGLLTSSLPIYLFLGYGHYRFEGTWADMSCLFEESQGMVFMILGGVFFGILTCLWEWRLSRSGALSQSSRRS